MVRIGGSSWTDAITPAALGSLLWQLAVVSLVPQILVDVVSWKLLGWSEFLGSPFGNALFQALEALTIALIGFGLGVIIQSLYPPAYFAGRFAWTLPFVLLTVRLRMI